MTGKRGNQYEVDPSSPADTDNRDGAHDQHLKDADKARVAKTRTDERESLIPQRAAQAPAGEPDAPHFEARDDAERPE